MKTTNFALLSFLATVCLSVVPATDAAAVYVVYPAADADNEDEALATLNQTPNDELEGGDDISVLRKGGGGGGVVGGVGGGRSSKRCKSGKTRVETLACNGDVTGKVRLIEGLNCPDLNAGDTAITVKGGATLDCGGNTIFGPGSGSYVGIEVKEGGIVRNCKIVGFGSAIYSTSSSSTITNCVVSDSIAALEYIPGLNALSPGGKYEAKNVYITGSVYGIYINLDGKTNKFKFDSITIANPNTSSNQNPNVSSLYYGIWVDCADGDMAGSSLTFNKITSAAPATFSNVEGSGTIIKIKSSIFDGGGVKYTEKSGTTNDIKLSIEKTLIINAPDDGIYFEPVASSSSTLDVSDSSVVLSGGDAGIYVDEGDVTLDSVELSGNGNDGLLTNNDVTAKNILVQFNGLDGITCNNLVSASVNIIDSKVCQNDDDDIGENGPGLTFNNVVCGQAVQGIGVTCPDTDTDTCTPDEKVATTSCD